MQILEAGNKYIVLRHVELVQWLDEPISEVNQETGETEVFYGFVVQLASGYRETIMYS